MIYTLSFTITNTGSTTVHWHFVSKLEDNKTSKRWSSIQPKRGLLLPERSATVEVKVKVDRLTAQLINAGKETLEDIVVLRIERAKDMYIALSGEFQRSCYGVSLDELVCTLEPIRNTIIPVKIQPGQVNEANGGSNSLKQAVPKELWRLIDALWTGGALREKDLFGETANEAEVS